MCVCASGVHIRDKWIAVVFESRITESFKILYDMCCACMHQMFSVNVLKSLSVLMQLDEMHSPLSADSPVSGLGSLDF